MRYAAARQQGMTEAKLAQVHDIDSDIFTPRERAAMRFATVMAQNNVAEADAVFAEVREYFDEAQIVELGLTISTFLGLNLFNNMDYMSRGAHQKKN